MNITVDIKKIQENWDTYFLATSKDISWFLVEWNTLDDIIDISPDVADSLIKARNKKISRQREIQQRINEMKYIYSPIAA